MKAANVLEEEHAFENSEPIYPVRKEQKEHVSCDTSGRGAYALVPHPTGPTGDMALLRHLL